jgi:hypothetical protein
MSPSPELHGKQTLAGLNLAHISNANADERRVFGDFGREELFAAIDRSKLSLACADFVPGT